MSVKAVVTPERRSRIALPFAALPRAHEQAIPSETRTVSANEFLVKGERREDEADEGDDLADAMLRNALAIWEPK